MESVLCFYNKLTFFPVLVIWFTTPDRGHGKADKDLWLCSQGTNRASGHVL